MKHVPGAWQLLSFSFFYIPFLSPYSYIGSYNNLVKAVEKYGDPITKTFRLTTSKSNSVWISDPKLLKEYFIAKAHNFEKPNYNVAAFFGENILSAQNNESWKKHFKVCNPAFGPKNLKYLCKVAVESCNSMFEMWDRRCDGTNNCILEHDDYPNLSLQILGLAGLNIDFGIYAEEAEGKQFRFHMVNMQSGRSIILKMFFDKESFMYKLIGRITGISQSIEFCSKYLDKMIEERKAKLKNEDFCEADEMSDILSLLVKANVIENSISNDELKSNSMVMSVAGHETTANALRWASYYISKNTQVQERLWREIDAVLNGRNPTYEDYQSLEYVNAVLLETLRLSPPVLHMGRVALKNLTLGEYEIKKGVSVIPMFGYVQRREDIWPNASEFNPERFLDPEVKANYQHNFTFAAFSFANRQCLGKNFALLEACMILSSMMQKYELKLLNDEETDPIVAVPFPVNRPSKNLKIQLSKRHD
ncbi:predicted protein [Naegleria gruberi]|uniref:Predicted protein n=1 Tax=Naegleria gruberi TaxID=5762 RepID=D2VKD5_NAEGR|nr:uncharacterized protein NAEGRDRAFT_69356 [Naegleria gruberi]EFC42580.1 predicted protein [Naegleria gruberi]|eukprot:XP_002675324.1 predicted protein [Naegleria gruberi strain NEG-M]